jgi:hypothetical protein
MENDDFRDDDLLPIPQAEMELIEQQLVPQVPFDSLLPKATNLNLTEGQVRELSNFQSMFVILGPAGGSVLVCPGNQENVLPQNKCPYAAKCPLLRVKKAPAGELCPIERNLVEQRFLGWCEKIEQNPATLTEDARSFVAELVYLDLQEQRCVNILSAGEEARLTQVNVTEAINYVTPEGTQAVLPLTWERVLHVNTERLDSIHERRRMLLKDWMLTPEQKWKIRKAEGKARGGDLGSQQSARGDKLRQLDPAFDL